MKCRASDAVTWWRWSIDFTVSSAKHRLSLVAQRATSAGRPLRKSLVMQVRLENKMARAIFRLDWFAYATIVGNNATVDNKLLHVIYIYSIF